MKLPEPTRVRLKTLIRRAAVWRGRDDQDIDEEIGFHLAEEARLRSERGQSSAEAEREARRAFGNTVLTKEEIREVWSWRQLDRLRQDLQYAQRAFRRNPALACQIVGSLTVGIAGMIAAFALVNAVLLRPFPGVEDQAALVEIDIRRSYQGLPFVFSASTTREDYRTLQAGLVDLEGLAAFTEMEIPTRTPETRLLRATFASPNYFEVLGLRPASGRAFRSGEGSDPDREVAVIAFAFWAREFGSDPSVIGRFIEVAGQSVRIVGVAPRHFAGLSTQFLDPRTRTDIWLPLALADRVSEPAPDGTRYLRYIGRLGGASLDRIGSEATLAARSIASAQGEPPEAFRASVSKLSMIAPDDASDARGFLVLVLAVPALVLIIGCVNAANLLLARGSHRQREIAVRLAIGAARSRVIGQLLAECLLLALASAMLGVPLAWLGLRLAGSFLPFRMPIDATVAVAGLVIAALTAVGFGLVPALRATRALPARTLGMAHAGSGGGRPTQVRARRALVAAQVALSLCLLGAGTQVLAALGSLRAGGGDVEPERLLVASFDLAQLRFSPAQADAFYERLLTRVSMLPESDAAGLARRAALWYLRAPGGQEPPPTIVWGPTDEQGRDHYGGYAGGDLFRAAGLRLLEGREFTPADRMVPPRVAVVNQPAADALEGPAVGQILRVVPRRPEGGPLQGFAPIEVQVVGVLSPALDPQIATIPQPALFLPSRLVEEPALALYARARGSMETLVAEVREIVDEIDPRVPTIELATLSELNRTALLPQRGFARALWFLGIVALGLASLGLYGVTSCIVARRSREVAIRFALGAQPAAILRLFLSQALLTAGTGIVLGGLGAVVAGSLIRAEILHAPDVDLLALAGPASILTGAVLVASTIPALRAARLDPVTMLRDD